jgi:hypothetical protein
MQSSSGCLLIFEVPTVTQSLSQQDMVPSKGINAEQQRLLANF